MVHKDIINKVCVAVHEDIFNVHKDIFSVHEDIHLKPTLDISLGPRLCLWTCALCLGHADQKRIFHHLGYKQPILNILMQPFIILDQSKSHFRPNQETHLETKLYKSVYDSKYTKFC